MGLRVTVLTAKKYAYDEPLDLILPELNNVRVVEIPYRGSKGKNENIYKSGSKMSGWKSLLITLLKRYSSLITRLTGVSFDVRNRWGNKALPIAISLCREENVDVIVSTFGPPACHFIASNVKGRLKGIKWVADYRDMWSIRHNQHLIGWQKRHEKRREKKTLASADLITTVSEPLAESLFLFLNKSVYVIYNGFDEDWGKVKARLACKSKSVSDRDRIKIVYTGMIYPGWQDPTPLFQAINSMIERGVISMNDVHIHFFGGRQFGLRALVAKEAAGGYVSIHGHVPREKALEAQRNADILLLMESGAKAAKGVLTGKIFEYMMSGKPVISLGSKSNSAIGELINKTKIGVVCEDDSEKITWALLKMLGGKQEEIYSPRIDFIAQFHRSFQATRFVKLINNVL